MAISPGFRYAMQAAVLILVCLSLYANTLHNDFVWDDAALIVDNRYLKEEINIPLFFTPCYWNRLHTFPEEGAYRPLRTLSFALDYHFWQLNPYGYHLTNLLLHIGNVLLVYWLLFLLSGSNRHTDFQISGAGQSLLPGLPFLTALFFAAHPVHTEAVTYIKNRGDLLCCLFFLLSFGLFLKMVGQTTRGRKRLFHLGIFSGFLLALFSKEMALTLPLILGLYALVFLAGKKRGRALLQTLPLWGIALLYGGVRQFWLTAPAVPAGSVDMELWQTALTGAKTMGYYFFLLLFPVNLNIEHLFSPSQSLLTPAGVLPALAVVLLCLLMIVAYKKSAWLCFGTGWILLTLLPVANFLVYLVSRPIAEQRLYIPSLGICLLMGLALCRISAGAAEVFRRRNVFAWILLVAIFLFYATGTVARNADWRNALSIWQICHQKNPLHNRARYNLGQAHLKNGNYKKAIQYLEQTLPHNHLQQSFSTLTAAKSYHSLGTAYMEVGRNALAIDYLKKALRMKQNRKSGRLLNMAGTANNLGLIYQRLGDGEQAEIYYQKALQFQRQESGLNHPNAAEILGNLGALHLSRKEYGTALLYSRQALAIFQKNYGFAHPSTVRARRNVFIITEKKKTADFSSGA